MKAFELNYDSITLVNYFISETFGVFLEKVILDQKSNSIAQFAEKS